MFLLAPYPHPTPLPATHTTARTHLFLQRGQLGPGVCQLYLQVVLLPGSRLGLGPQLINVCLQRLDRPLCTAQLVAQLRHLEREGEKGVVLLR